MTDVADAPAMLRAVLAERVERLDVVLLGSDLPSDVYHRLRVERDDLHAHVTRLDARADAQFDVIPPQPKFDLLARCESALAELRSMPDSPRVRNLIRDCEAIAADAMLVKHGTTRVAKPAQPAAKRSVSKRGKGK